MSGLGFDQSQQLLGDPSTFGVSNAQLSPSQYLSTVQSQSFPQQQQQQQVLSDPSFLPSNPTLSQHNTPHFGPQGSNLNPDPLDLTNNGSSDFNSFLASNDFNQNQSISTLKFGISSRPASQTTS